jgi:hypothetical protein
MPDEVLFHGDFTWRRPLLRVAVNKSVNAIVSLWLEYLPLLHHETRGRAASGKEDH